MKVARDKRVAAGLVVALAVLLLLLIRPWSYSAEDSARPPSASSDTGSERVQQPHESIVLPEGATESRTQSSHSRVADSPLTSQLPAVDPAELYPFLGNEIAVDGVRLNDADFSSMPAEDLVKWQKAVTKYATLQVERPWLIENESLRVGHLNGTQASEASASSSGYYYVRDRVFDEAVGRDIVKFLAVPMSSHPGFRELAEAGAEIVNQPRYQAWVKGTLVLEPLGNFDHETLVLTATSGGSRLAVHDSGGTLVTEVRVMIPGSP
jgi:hypothetical protein